MNQTASFLCPAEQLVSLSPVSVIVLPDLPALFAHFARAILDEIITNNAANRPTRFILPVGPVGQYPLLAKLSIDERVSWRNVHVFLMDEYCDWQGRRIPHTHPLSFLGFAKRELFDKLPHELALPESQLHIPDPAQIERIGEEIQKMGGIDTCYGGVGIHGHIAFNEPPISRWFKVSAEEFKASKTRLVQLAPETMVMNASRGASGDFSALPPMAVTLGMADILASKRIRLYCQGGVWQRNVLRMALFGSPAIADGEDVDFPVTLLRSHPDLAIVTDEVTAQPPISQMAA